jgi:hypothetical protein
LIKNEEIVALEEISKFSIFKKINYEINFNFKEQRDTMRALLVILNESFKIVVEKFNDYDTLLLKQTKEMDLLNQVHQVN